MTGTSKEGKETGRCRVVTVCVCVVFPICNQFFHMTALRKLSGRIATVRLILIDN